MIIDKEKIYFNQIKELKDLIKVKNEMGVKIPTDNLFTNNLIDNELKLSDLNKKIRKEWIKKVGIINSDIYKSSLWGTNVKDLQGYSYHFSYETLLNDENELADLWGYKINDMNSKTFLFSNGMNAITNIFYCLASFVREPLNVQTSVGYFETKYFLKILQSMGNKVDFKFQKNTSANVFYFEPIRYDSSLTTTDMNELIESINTSNSKLKIVMMDSTMHNRTNIFKSLKNQINNIENVIFIDIRSGLKLDEEGLELTNLGITTIFISQKNKRLFSGTKNYIEQYKGLTGTNLSFYSLCLSHYFKELRSNQYSKNVDEQILWAVNSLDLKNSGIIKNSIWKKADFFEETLVVPFIFLELNKNDEKYYLYILHKIQNMMKNLGLKLDYRNSWGFRLPSIEYFNDIFTHKKYIKYYPGSFKGLTASELIKCINNL